MASSAQEFLLVRLRLNWRQAVFGLNRYWQEIETSKNKVIALRVAGCAAPSWEVISPVSIIVWQ
jgi:hypothetical protein